MIAKLVLFAFLVAFGIATGWIHAILWSKKGAEAYKWNEHILLTSQVGLFFALPLVVFFYAKTLTFWSLLTVLSAGWAAFAFFHPSTYYWARHHIDKAYSGPFDEPSSGSTAWINLPTWARIVALIVSIVIMTLAL